MTFHPDDALLALMAPSVVLLPVAIWAVLKARKEFREEAARQEELRLEIASCLSSRLAGEK